jgi:Lamin Tail Domain
VHGPRTEQPGPSNNWGHIVKRLSFVLAASLLLGGAAAVSPTVAPAADAAGCVSIYRVWFDSPGSDYGSNTSLNAEWIQLHNHCVSTNKSLTGWTIKDASVHTYTFGTYSLKAGAYVKIHTGTGTNTAANRYQNKGAYIWNNTGDTAYLRNSAETLVDKCVFSGAGDAAYC